VRAFVLEYPPGGRCFVPPNNEVSAEQGEGRRLGLIKVFDVIERIPRLLAVEPRRIGTASREFVNLARRWDTRMPRGVIGGAVILSLSTLQALSLFCKLMLVTKL
jgi:hypothetical protein